MKTLRKYTRFLLCLPIIAAVLLLQVSAKTGYQTYTFSYEGDAQISPDAYVPSTEITEFGTDVPLNKPQDMVTDEENGRIIIADTGNNRIVVLNTEFQCLKILTEYLDTKGTTVSFSEPQGVFVRNDGILYVADTGNGNIVSFDPEYRQVNMYPPLSAEILPDNFIYTPKSLAVDHTGRMYIISKNTNMGVIAINKNGNFQGFIGAQRVTASPTELLMRAFMSEAQIERSAQFVPMEYSNITIDDKGFLYVVSGQIDRYKLWESVWSRSSGSTYAPLKKINTSGTDVLRRNGFFPPVGDINFDAYDNGNSDERVDPSQLTEVTLLENGMYLVVDSDSNKIFTYDSYGNLLYAFGGTGESPGLYNQISSVERLGSKLLALDTQDASVTVLERTRYGELLNEVIGYQENREFDKAQDLWQEVLDLNNNFDLAYLGIGKIYLENGDYSQAMHYFKLINNQSYYSKAYKLLRTQQLEKTGIFVMIGIVAAVILVAYFFGFAKRYNQKRRMVPATGRLRDELMFGVYTMFHPFNGFYELKNEKRGSKKAAGIFTASAVLAYLLRNFASGYLQKNVDSAPSLLSSLANVLLPVALWCVANWCLTSLMDGKGTMSDIFTATAYSLLPMILFTTITTVVSHFLVGDELVMLNFVYVIGIAWTLLLVFLSMINTHEYTLSRAVAVFLLSVLVIGIILFLLMILFSLSGRMVSLVYNIIEELSFRS